MLNVGIFRKTKLDYTTFISDIANINSKYGYISSVIGKANPPHIGDGTALHELTWDYDSNQVVLKLGENGTDKIEDTSYMLLVFNYDATGIIAEWDSDKNCYIANGATDYIDPIKHRDKVYIKILPIPEELIDLDFSYPKVGKNNITIIA